LGLALGILKNARDKASKRYNELRSKVEFRVGGKVLVNLHPQSSRAQNRSSKLENKWFELVLIAKLLTKFTVQLNSTEYWVGD
jgi:hypothetical protein